MRVLVSGNEGGSACLFVPTLFEVGFFSEGGFE
jgi:hypothetical protein